MKTIFHEIPTANYIRFLIDIMIKKEAHCPIPSAQLLKLFTFTLIHFSKQPNIEKAIASFHNNRLFC